jgi:transposase-like protein
MVRAVVDSGLSKAAAARRYNTTPKTVAKWVKRFRAERVDGLHDRSSRPLSSPAQTPLPHAPPLKLCAVSATQTSTSPASSARAFSSRPECPAFEFLASFS